MFGRIALILLCLLTLQTNLFARGCVHRTFGWSGTNQSSWPGYSCSAQHYENGNWICLIGDYSYGSTAGYCYDGGGSQVSVGFSCGWGANDGSCRGSGWCCDGRCAADSLICMQNNEIWHSENCTCDPDTTFKCTSVSTENNVIRSQIDYLVHNESVKQRYVLGSCIDNNFCEGGSERTFDPVNNPTYAYDSCSYDSVSTSKCNFVGQNGSACNYVCPDGRNWMCRMATTTGVNIPQCPSKPWKDCADNYVPAKVNTPPNAMSTDSLMENVIGIWPEPDYSNDNLAGALESMTDDLHDIIMQQKIDNYANQKMYDVVGGYGSFEDDGIWQNTKRIDENLAQVNANVGATNNNLNSVIINQNTIIKHIENDTIPVQVHNTQDRPLWVMPDWTPMVFAVDTNTEKINNTLSTIKNQVDTLVLDTPRTNSVLGGIALKFDSVKVFLDSMSHNIKNPLDYVTDYAQGIADSISQKLKPYLDNILVDSAKADSLINTFDIGNLPDITLDTLSTDTLPFDTIPFDSTFFDDVDSLVQYLDSLNQERLKVDTTKDTLPLDQLSGDSADIRNKLSDIFLTDLVLEQCFEFHMHPVISVTIRGKTFRYDLSMVIDFADLFGWDLCGFIRRIVEILTFILIVFTTIKGYIRAFGGSNIGG